MIRYARDLQETELRLGLPGVRGSGCGEGDIVVKATGAKRGFAETSSAVDLELNLPTGKTTSKVSKAGTELHLLTCTDDHAKPPSPKPDIVGWPPLRSYRKNVISVQFEKNNIDETNRVTNGSVGALVKVSMDGAPYLRKVDLNMYKSYQDLSIALENMFSSFTIIKCGADGGDVIGRDFMNERKLTDSINGSDYVPTYEDRDGDWMLVGDVPWEMFVYLCKRLRIMKGSEAIGLAPRAVEKCKSEVN